MNQIGEALKYKSLQSFMITIRTGYVIYVLYVVFS